MTTLTEFLEPGGVSALSSEGGEVSVAPLVLRASCTAALDGLVALSTVPGCNEERGLSVLLIVDSDALIDSSSSKRTDFKCCLSILDGVRSRVNRSSFST